MRMICLSAIFVDIVNIPGFYTGISRLSLYVLLRPALVGPEYRNDRADGLLTKKYRVRGVCKWYTAELSRQERQRKGW
jgi:hypothetical protein